MRRKTTAGTKVHAELYRAVEKMKQATHHLNEQKRYHMLQLSFTELWCGARHVALYVDAHDAQRDAENAEYVAKLCSALVMPNSVQRQKRRRIASFDFRCLSTLASRVAPGSVFGRSHFTIIRTRTAPSGGSSRRATSRCWRRNSRRANPSRRPGRKVCAPVPLCGGDGDDDETHC